MLNSELLSVIDDALEKKTLALRKNLNRAIDAVHDDAAGKFTMDRSSCLVQYFIISL